MGIGFFFCQYQFKKESRPKILFYIYILVCVDIGTKTTEL